MPTQLPAWVKKRLGKSFYRFHFDKGFATSGAFASLFGGHPDERPEPYARYSPVTHIHPQCPATLLIHGLDDTMAPVTTTVDLFKRLTAANVPTVLHLLPQTDHAFDLVFPHLSPSAHNAVYDVERFLAVLT